MGMILRIASSRIVGQGDIVGRSGYFSLNLSANSVMRGRLDARRTLKSLVADLRLSKKLSEIGQDLKSLINTKEVFDPIKETLFFTCIYKLFWIIVLCLLLFSLLFSVRHVPGKVPGVLFSLYS